MTADNTHLVISGVAGVDAAVFVVSAVGATIFHFVRKNRSVRSGTGQWLGDALNIGTILVLFLILIKVITASLWGDAFSFIPDVSETNGMLILVSFAYCIIVISTNLLSSCAQPASGGAPS
ncbi:hypothetical protein [Brevundimonas sp. A19_0]|uniref:hypothetical protein n=1 Tax=Brevundimonas sp. A19_0 TaxID=2821087 RepID=UPI001AD9DB0E|nr:hypothetical protein [Brevundimonas sp. A19_0]MBO9501451.1 hypothetical protein [Brevundimonas sp. A19_0]